MIGILHKMLGCMVAGFISLKKGPTKGRLGSLVGSPGVCWLPLGDDWGLLESLKLYYAWYVGLASKGLPNRNVGSMYVCSGC